MQTDGKQTSTAFSRGALVREGVGCGSAAYLRDDVSYLDVVKRNGGG